MAIPPQRFRAEAPDDPGQLSNRIQTESGEAIRLSFTQLRGSPFGSDIREFRVRRNGEKIGTLDVAEDPGMSPDAGSANTSVQFLDPGTYTITDAASKRNVTVNVEGDVPGTGVSGADFDPDPPPEPPAPASANNPNVVAGGGAGEALQAGYTTEQLSGRGPISPADADALTSGINPFEGESDGLLGRVGGITAILVGIIALVILGWS
jgi:hypothetical protein